MTFIKSKLRNVIDIQGASTSAGALLDAFPQKPADNANQQWEFVVDPAGSGHFFIKSALSGHVIDVQGNSAAAGAHLDAFPQKTSGYDNQLWTAVDGTVPRNMWLWEAPEKGFGSGANSANFSAGLTLISDGTAIFAGQYQDTGSLPVLTAPAQNYTVTCAVLASGNPATALLFSHSASNVATNGAIDAWRSQQWLSSLTPKPATTTVVPVAKYRPVLE